LPGSFGADKTEELLWRLLIVEATIKDLAIFDNIFAGS
jgi:hypothetical protein